MNKKKKQKKKKKKEYTPGNKECKKGTAGKELERIKKSYLKGLKNLLYGVRGF